MSIMAQHAALNYQRFGVLRTLIAVFLAGILFLSSTTFFLYRSLANQLSEQTIDLSQFGDTPVDQQGTPIPEDAFEGRALNILVIGIDSRYEQGENSNGDPEEFTTIFSDTAMVMHISADRSRISTVSIPRDLMTDIPSCIDANGEHTDPHFGQFNSAFRIGAVTDSIPHGIQCTKNTVEELSGLRMDAFVVVDFKGFIGVVDALGGVWYHVEERIEDPRADADLMEGCQLLNGKQALSYARTRYAVGNGSDLERIGRQQKLVAALIREALSKNFVTDFGALYNFLQEGIRAVKVSPNLGVLNDDVGLLLSLASIDTKNIEFMTLPNEEWAEDRNRAIAIEYQAAEVWEALRMDRPFPANYNVTNGQGEATLTGENGAQSDQPGLTEGAPGVGEASEGAGAPEGAGTAEREQPSVESPATEAPAPSPVVCGPPQ